MPNELLIKNVRPLHSEAVDVLSVDGRITAVEAGLKASPDAEVIDGEGKLLFPGFVDAHAHMDKTMIGMPWYRREVGRSLVQMISDEREMRLRPDWDYHRQTARQARIMVAAGTTHVRTFVDVDTDGKLAGLEGLLKTREEFKDALSMKVIAFAQSGLLPRPGTAELMEAALKNGADIVGGMDPCLIERDPKGHLDVIFGLAEKYDRDVDIHLHEVGHLGAFSMELIAERVKTLGWQGRVVISHPGFLAGIDEAYAGRIIDLLLENRIAITSNGPGGDTPTPPMKRLYQAGVTCSCGCDGIRDSWGPMNKSDMLGKTYLVAHRNGLSADEELEIALDISTYGGAAVMGEKAYGVTVGCDADLVLVDSENHLSAILEQPARSLVLKRGRVVARDGECLI